MNSVLAARWQFGFTLTYHYLYPQLTMGLTLLIFALKTMALRGGGRRYDEAARFWTKILAITFAAGVVTGIPMEFQFGTNWARFSEFAGGVIGQSLALEGIFAFFLESAFLGLLLYGEDRLGARGHWAASLLVFLGSWTSGWFIISANAWMQHPVGYRPGPRGGLELESFGALMSNPWLIWQFLHNMCGTTVTASFVMAGIGAYYLLAHRDEAHARIFVRTGVTAGVIASILLLYPTGDEQGRNLARYAPVTLAAAEGLFESERGAGLALIGQPDMENLRLDNPLRIPNVLSFLTYRRWEAEVKGLLAFPRDTWPDNVPLVYFAYHIMVGLGSIFIVCMLIAVWGLRRGRLYHSRGMLWMLLVLTPFPYVSNTAGWITAEVGRQPWVVRGLLRTEHAHSAVVSAGNTMFSLLGFMGAYTLLSVLYLLLIWRVVQAGPVGDAATRRHSDAATR